MGPAAPLSSIIRIGVACIALQGCGGDRIVLGAVPAGAGGMGSPIGGGGGQGGGASGAAGSSVTPAQSGTSGGGAGSGGSNTTAGSGSGGSEVTGAGGASGSDSAGADSGGEAGEASCERGIVQATEVVWLGDSWVLFPMGEQTERVRDRAREAGTIDITEDYENEAVAGAYMVDVVGQYERFLADPTKDAPKVLLMDGGTFDTVMAASTGVPLADAVASVIATFEEFLIQVADDGTVEHIVYFLMPENQGIAGVGSLRGPLEDLCTYSAVSCHFLDLSDDWPQGYSNGIQPSAYGAVAIGDRIWAIMQDNCIAQ